MLKASYDGTPISIRVRIRSYLKGQTRTASSLQCIGKPKQRRLRPNLKDDKEQDEQRNIFNDFHSFGPNTEKRRVPMVVRADGTVNESPVEMV